MGADLIGFFLKGPNMLDREKVQDAIKRAERAKRYADLALNDFVAFDSAEPLEWLTDLGVEAFRNEEVDIEDPEQFVYEFIEFWEATWGSGVRDIAWRIDPDDSKQILVFAGERSWGDEPDGYGYQMFKKAELCGVLEPFGIR